MVSCHGHFSDCDRTVGMAMNLENFILIFLFFYADQRSAFMPVSAALLIEKSINECYNMEECCDERYKVSGGAINGEWK